MQISDKATVETSHIGQNAVISEYCVIRQDVKIGNDVVIHPNVTIYDGVEIGNGVEIFPGTFLGKKPKGAGVSARELDFEKRIRIGENSSIGPNCVIYYDVDIGGYCLLGDGAAIREKCKIASRCIIGRFVSLLYEVEVGKNTRIMTNSQITGNTYIGNDVFISVGLNTVNDNAFGDLGYDDHVKGQRIESGAKIGAGVTILPNININEQAVVGSGSVVTKDVESKSLVMGVPAKHVRYVEE